MARLLPLDEHAQRAGVPETVKVRDPPRQLIVYNQEAVSEFQAQRDDFSFSPAQIDDGRHQ